MIGISNTRDRVTAPAIVFSQAFRSVKSRYKRFQGDRNSHLCASVAQPASAHFRTRHPEVRVTARPTLPWTKGEARGLSLEECGTKFKSSIVDCANSRHGRGRRTTIESPSHWFNRCFARRPNGQMNKPYCFESLGVRIV